MADDSTKKPSIFNKMIEAGAALLDEQIAKAKSSVMNQAVDDDFFYSKAITEDPSYAIHASGWKDKPHRLMDGHLRQISINNSVVAAVIQTRQNQVSNHSNLVKSEKERGWMLCLRDEEALLEKIKEELQAEAGVQEPDSEDGSEEIDPAAIQKADLGEDASVSTEVEDAGVVDPNASEKSDNEVEEYNFELERKAKERLATKFKDAKKKAQDYLINCGLTDNRPFESKKWKLDAALRAIVRDSLTYDRYAVEVVPDRAGRTHHWFPIDGATVKFASNRLRDYKQLADNFMNLDILYPENQVEAMEKQKVLELKPELLDADRYKYVQVIRGKIERAYTEDELKLGIRNITTDIYNNGYGVSELELCVSLVTGHLNAEFYNQAYFTQGFSAKGILHIKAAINRRKLETVRQQWQHMLKGARNSFQTPIFAGMEEVSWIPLTQNHNDIGFEGWMRYLIKMICAIYQIDPHEIGIGFKDEGSGGGSLGGDATKEKMDQSKDKGLYPLLRHIEDFINEQILKPFDSRFVLKFTGITDESKTESVDRQDKERKFKKTVNEIRAEDGLPPLPGMDDFIAGPEFATWYGQFSQKALDLQAQVQQQQLDSVQAQNGDVDPEEDESFYGGDLESNLIQPEEAEIPGEPKPMKKSMKTKRPARVKVEYYRFRK